MDAPGTSAEKSVAMAGLNPSFALPELQADGQKAPEVKYSEWMPEPPADPVISRRLKKVRWEVGATLIFLIALWGGLVFAFFHMKHGGLMNPLAQVLAPASAMLWMYVRSRRASPHLTDLLDLPPVCPQFPVELTYRNSQVVYGSDQGIVSLFDGWMHFQGRRTSWSLSTNELKSYHWSRRTTNSGMLAAVKSSAAFHTFKWDYGPNNLSVVMLPMNDIEGLGGDLRKKFDRAIEPWFSSPGKASEKLLWPPTMAQPGLVRRRAMIRRVWSLIRWAPAIFAAGAFVEIFLSDWPWWVAVTAVAIACWLFAELFLACASRTLAAVNERTAEAEQIDFRLPARPWWDRIGLKL